MGTASPNTILRLAAAQSSTFFRPSPHFLATATARELGNWARACQTNEGELQLRLEEGVEGLLSLALKHCGLTMERIRELHLMRLSIINPVTDVIDKCVGKQWYAQPDFWDGGVDDAYTIDADPPTTIFHLALYGELFGPDFEAYLNPITRDQRRLSVETRLEFVKYCIPDVACQDCADDAAEIHLPDGTIDPRRAVKKTGPYADDAIKSWSLNGNIGLVWVLMSTRWRPHWKGMRAMAAASDFKTDFEESWWYDPDEEQSWRQRMLESIMVSQGLEGLGMMRPALQEHWIEKVRDWKDKIANLDKPPEAVKVGRQATYDFPFLLGDLRICGSGYVSGT